MQIKKTEIGKLFKKLKLEVRSTKHRYGWFTFQGKDIGVRPTQLTENRKNRLAKLFRILTCQMSRSDTHALLS